MPDENKKIGLGDKALITIIKRPTSDRQRAADEDALSRLRARWKEPRGPYVEVDDPIQTGRMRIQLFDLATRFGHLDPNVRVGWALVLNTGSNSLVNNEPDWVNGYIEFDLETNSQSQVALKQLREAYLFNQPDPSGFSKTTHAQRPVPNCWPLAHNCGSMFLDLNVKRDDLGVSRKYVLQNGQVDWVRVQTLAARRVNFESIGSRVSDPSAQREFNEQLELLRKSETENWLSIQSGITRDKEGILRPRSVPGGYHLQLDSPFYYEPFSTSDPTNYKITSQPDFESESVSIGRIEHTDKVRVFLVPQLWRVRFTWFAWYLFATFWAFTFVRVPNTRVFFNRFPLFPRWFEIGSGSGDPFTLAPAWQWIERSQAHQQGAASDLALQFFSPFIAMIFVFTSDGFFEITRTDTFAGSLSAVLEINGTRRYIWRRTNFNRDLTLRISQGVLNTNWISSIGTEVIGGFPGLF